jgi:protein TonB
MSEKLDHIVFEGRNRDYGAYSIRKRHAGVVIRSFLVTALFFGLISGGMLSWYYFEDIPTISAGDLLATYEMMNMEDDVELPVPPDAPRQRQEIEAMVPMPVLNTTPEIVKVRTPLPEIKERKEQEIKDTTVKTGDHLAVKGTPGEGSDTGAVYIKVEKLPEFPGGRQALDKFLRENIKYPAVAVQKKLSGVVHVSFMISRYGRIERVKVSKSVDPAIDNEAVRVVKAMPSWTPGRRHGQPVNVLLTLPIRFLPAG